MKENTTSDNQQADWLERFNVLISERLSNPSLTNAELAKLMFVNERKLYRTVRELTNLSPNLYIRRVRLQKAHGLLESGNYSTVKEVVTQVGFIKVKYFYKIFKMEFIRDSSKL